MKDKDFLPKYFRWITCYLGSLGSALPIEGRLTSATCRGIPHLKSGPSLRSSGDSSRLDVKRVQVAIGELQGEARQSCPVGAPYNEEIYVGLATVGTILKSA